MKRFIFTSLCLASCSIGGGLMTMNEYQEISIGSTRSEVIATAGEPTSITKKDDGSIEYEYVERIKVGYRDLVERRYIIVLKDGVVVCKRVDQSSPLPYAFDSYDMQTTQKQPYWI